jgi:adenylate cyclase
VRDDLDEETLGKIEAFHRFLALYRSQAWDEALRALNELRSSCGDCTLFDLYEQRIDTFRTEPPPADWDGVFVHTSK